MVSVFARHMQWLASLHLVYHFAWYRDATSGQAARAPPSTHTPPTILTAATPSILQVRISGIPSQYASVSLVGGCRSLAAACESHVAHHPRSCNKTVQIFSFAADVVSWPVVPSTSCYLLLLTSTCTMCKATESLQHLLTAGNTPFTGPSFRRLASCVAAVRVGGHPIG